MIANVSADLYRIAFRFSSTEQTRYYLQGVYVERCQTNGGVQLVATNGHQMFVAYDPTGYTDENKVIRLTDAAMKECKSRDLGRRISIEGKIAYIEDAQATRLAISQDCIVDGTFPDWLRVVPKFNSNPSFVSYNAAQMIDFCWAARELATLRGASKKEKVSIQFVGTIGEPQFVLFNNQTSQSPPAFGIFMPMEMESKSLPAWFTEQQNIPEQVEQAA